MSDDYNKTERHHVSEIHAAGGLEAFIRKLQARNKGMSFQTGSTPPQRSRKPYATGSSYESEHDAQARLLSHFRSLEDHFPEYVLVFAVPNAAKRKTGGWSVAEGLKAGVPDLCWPLPADGFHGLYVEMKRDDGGQGPTESQSAWLKILKLLGFKATVCNGYDEAMRVFDDHFEGYCAAHDMFDQEAVRRACLDLVKILRKNWKSRK